MKNHSKIIELLEQFYHETADRKKTILLGSSAYVLFNKRQLFNELLNRTTTIKNFGSFQVYFQDLVKKGFVSVNKKSRRGSDGSKTYFLSDDGIAQLPLDYYNFIQVLVDDCSEEVETPTSDQLQCNEIEAPKAQPEISDSDKIIYMCDLLEQTLLSKNTSYGNSSLKPIGVFDLPRTAKVQSRLEDKISRLSQVSRGEDKEALRDTLLDLAGYSILYLIILEEEK